MTLMEFVKEPLEGKTSLSRVVWLYGGLGSVLYGAIELFLDPTRVWLTRAYSMGGLIFSVYVTIGTYRCAANCGSPLLAKVVRVSCIITLPLLPVLTYLELSGALSLDALLGGEQMPEF